MKSGNMAFYACATVIQMINVHKTIKEPRSQCKNKRLIRGGATVSISTCFNYTAFSLYVITVLCLLLYMRSCPFLIIGQTTTYSKFEQTFDTDGVACRLFCAFDDKIDTLLTVCCAFILIPF